MTPKLESAIRAVLAYGLIAGLLCPQLVSLYAQQLSRTCAMKCCRLKGAACCKRLKAGDRRPLAIQAVPECAERCRQQSATLSRAGDDAQRPAVAWMPQLSRRLGDVSPAVHSSGSPGFDRLSVQRPPPSLFHSSISS
ncbi:MAG: hypothetical protein JNL98_21670 [Bryobacterales bacterium]|nr:hypothetical protein [Bryobacterales bacterium]